MYEYMAEFKAVHVMQLPNSASDAASRALWKAEILRLQQAIEARFGTPITEAALREAVILKTVNVVHWRTSTALVSSTHPHSAAVTF